jgi:hypothetical protein
MIFLNILLLTAGFIGALAAFGGKTWKEGDEPLLNRITKRGWVSVICLSAALGFGITKEVLTSKDKHAAERQQARLNDQIHLQRLLIHNSRIDEINQKLKIIGMIIDRFRSVRRAHPLSMTITIFGRSLLSKPFEFGSMDFRFDVCSEKFKAASGVTFALDECRSTNTVALVDLLSESRFDQNRFSKNLVAILSYFSSISVSHYESLNGSYLLSDVDGRKIKLADLYGEATKYCDMPHEKAAKQAEYARLLGEIEESGKELYWLYRFGFNEKRNSTANNNRLLSARRKYFLSVTRLDEVIEHPPQEPVYRGYELGRIVDNVERLQILVAHGALKTEEACEDITVALNSELKQIKDAPDSNGAYSKLTR